MDVAGALLARRAKMIVVACNSATAAAMPALRRRMMETTLGVDVLGVVRPEAVQAAAATRTGSIGLLATPTTVGSGAYAEALASVDPHVTLTAVPCPDLAPVIQGGFPFDAGLVDTVRGYCRPLREADVDTVILGCTHYPLVRPMLQRMLGPGVQLVTSGAALARQVGHALAGRGLAHPGEADREGDYRFLTTGDVETFRALGTRFLQMPLGEIEHVTCPRASRHDAVDCVDGRRCVARRRHAGSGEVGWIGRTTAGRAGCARRASSRGSCPPRQAPPSSRRARRASSAPRR